MKHEIYKIEKALYRAFKDLDLNCESIDDAVFHMTDWLSELQNLNAFYENPESLTPEKSSELIMAFLVHAPAHIAAASKLVTGLPVSDVFNFGATSEGKSS